VLLIVISYEAKQNTGKVGSAVTHVVSVQEVSNLNLNRSIMCSDLEALCFCTPVFLKNFVLALSRSFVIVSAFAPLPLSSVCRHPCSDIHTSFLQRTKEMMV
jgi:hypothetical protein